MRRAFDSRDECATLTHMDDFDIPAVGVAISRLRESQCSAFGPEGHGFRLNPALSESDAAAFERGHKVVLPSDCEQ